jgi:hypothetical protein
MVRYPMGGILSATRQWLVGLQRLGHEIYLLEKSGWPRSCYDPSTDEMTNDCSHGAAVVNCLLARHGLQDHWCFVDASGEYHGMSEPKVAELFRSADIFIDRGRVSGEWSTQARQVPRTVFIDVDPAFTQMQMANSVAKGRTSFAYDHYYTVGLNIGTPACSAPTAAKQWRTTYNPVVLDLFPCSPVKEDAPFTTVMHWQPYEPVTYGGRTYGQKDVEFTKFITLPKLANTSLEVAVSGENVPREELRGYGWELRSPGAVTKTVDSYVDYICESRGEFSVCKNAYVATNSGWFSDRSAAYLACSRPVVMQDTGFSNQLPCGRGLFAVRTVEEAVAAIGEISAHLDQHSKWARELAAEYLRTEVVLGRMLRELGL